MKKNKGFTLIELLVVIAIIGVLASVVFVASTANAGWFSPSIPDTNATNSFRREVAQTEVQQRLHMDNTPIPTVEKSQERINLKKRIERFNTDDKVSYIYLVNYGKVMAFYTVKGKVSSLNSYLTNDVQLVNGRGELCDYLTSNCYAVPSPDLDGSYGDNGEGIFFFTTDDVYVEWKGEYMLADQALKLTTQPELVRIIQ